MSRVRNDELVEAFIDGEDAQANSAHADADGTLYSYRTAVAIRRPDGTFAVTQAKYSQTTSCLVGKLTRALYRAGYREVPPLTTIHAAVPGRWGGFGPAWHATGWEDVPAVIWAAL